MSDYYIARDEDGKAVLIHERKHKYIKKIGDRYFYTQQEIEAFLKKEKGNYKEYHKDNNSVPGILDAPNGNYLKNPKTGRYDIELKKKKKTALRKAVRNAVAEDTPGGAIALERDWAKRNTNKVASRTSRSTSKASTNYKTERKNRKRQERVQAIKDFINPPIKVSHEVQYGHSGEHPQQARYNARKKKKSRVTVEHNVQIGRGKRS